VSVKHTILFLAANPSGLDRLALDREARAIQKELESASNRDCFVLETRWAAEPLDLLRELRKLKPTVVHFSGQGGQGMADVQQPHGLFFQGHDGRAQFVSTVALEETFGAAGASVKVVVLNACYSETQAEALLAHVECVVGMRGAIPDGAARSFAIGFYGGLGDRESIAAAYDQGCAAISLEGLGDRDRPRLAVRDGVDASALILAADPVEPAASRPGASAVATSRPGRPGSSIAAPLTVDIGILTIRDDEFRAVLGAFPSKAGFYRGAKTSREYTLRHADAGDGAQYTVAVLCQIEQGNGEAQNAARDLIEDFAPRLILVVGIAGGLPSDDVTLGDVILSMRIHDFTVEAREADDGSTYSTAGGPVAKALASALANLPAREDDLGDWAAALPSQPLVSWTQEGQIYGPPDWQTKLRTTLERHYGAGFTPRAPIYAAGPIASSDRLVKDPTVLIPWLQTARKLLAVEMESGGVYRAAQERCPMLAIRGISDIIGLKRADAWTKYACASAAAFTRAFLRTRPVLASATVSPPS
jgi:nucleoside phosphorylase